MANTYNGDFNYSYSLNVETAKPLDSRTVVSTKDDLSTIPYTYKGMMVSIAGTDTVYILTAENGEDINNWKKVGSDELPIENINTNLETLRADIGTVSADVDIISSNADIVSTNLNTLSSNLIGISNTNITASNLSIIGDYNSKAVLTNGIQYYIHEYPNKDFDHADNGYTTMGQRGYYIHYIDTTGLSSVKDAVGSTLVFYISSNQLTQELAEKPEIDDSFDSGYKVGDIISYNTDQAWVNFGKISKIEHNKITITSTEDYPFNIHCNDSHSNPNASGNVGEWKTQLNSNKNPNGTRFTSFYVVDRPNTGACLINHVAASIGYWTKATGLGSLAANNQCTAAGQYSTALGSSNYAGGIGSTVLGRFAEKDIRGEYLFVVGDGNSKTRHNAFTINNYGNATFNNDVQINNLAVNKIESATSTIFGDTFIDTDKNKIIENECNQKGYYFASKIEASDTNYDENTTYTVAITSSEKQPAFTSLFDKPSAAKISNFKSELSKNDVLTMKNVHLISDALTVTNVDSNVITYKIDTTKIHSTGINSDPIHQQWMSATGQQYEEVSGTNPKDFSELTICCHEKPNVGAMQLVKYSAIVGGWGSKIYGNAALASGRETTVVADYGVALGRATKAGYASIACGQGAKAIHNYCAVFGGANETASNVQFIVGPGGYKTPKDVFFAVITNKDHSIGNGSATFEVGHQYAKINGDLTLNGSININSTTPHNIIASGKKSLAVGYENYVSANCCACIGRACSAIHEDSATFGKGNITQTTFQTVVGKYNAQTSSLFVVGGGSGDASRKNLFEVTTTGIKIGNTTITETQLQKLLALI